MTASSGNHAQALALSAALHDAPATILMPEDAPASKAAATEGYGARIIRFDRYSADREALMAEHAERDGLAIVHPYDDERIMAGQGTAALELIEDGGPLDLLLVPVGGGGLIAGCATAARGLLPGRPGRRRRARGRRRHAALARGRRARPRPGRPDDRRRPAARHPRASAPSR